MLKVLISGITGLALGFIGAYKIFAVASETPISTHKANNIDYINKLKALNHKIAVQQFENELLLKMVRSGKGRNIKEHIKTFQQLSDPENPTNNQVLSSSQLPEPTNSKQLITQIYKADIALQKQALSEGWANDETFSMERQNLWATARNNLTDQEYMEGLYVAQLPNVLYVDSVNSAVSDKIKRGDVLTHIAQERIFNRDDLRRIFKKFNDAPLELMFNRKGRTYTAEVTNIAKNIDFTGYSIKQLN